MESTTFTHFKYRYIGEENASIYDYGCLVMDKKDEIHVVVMSDAKPEFKAWLNKKRDEAETYRDVVRMQAKILNETIDRLELDDNRYMLFEIDGKIQARIYDRIHEDLEPATFFDVRKR